MRIGIIGGGFGARVHLPAFEALEGATVVAIADSGSGSAKLHAPHVDYFDDWQQMIAAAALDAITVATPPSMHARIVSAALRKGLSVLCEKPFGLTIEDAEAMCIQQRPTGLTGAVNFQLRFEPAIAALRREITNQRIGRLRRIDITWETTGRSSPDAPWSWQHEAKAGGGVINGFFSHVADLLPWFTGRKIRSAYGRARILIEKRPGPNGNLVPVTAEDSMDAFIDLDDAVAATVRITNCQPSGAGLRIEANGEEGRLVCEHRQPLTTNDWSLAYLAPLKDPQSVPFSCLDGNPDRDPRVPAEQKLLEQFVNAATGRAAFDLPTFDDGLKARQVMQALFQSIETGRNVPVAAA